MSARKTPPTPSRPGPGRATRRGALGLLAGAGVAAWLVGPRLARRMAPLDLESIAGLAPFQRLAGAAEASGLASGSPVLVGLGGAEPPGTAALRAKLAADPCPALFRGAAAGDAVPVAYFSDIRCPWCRVTEQRLADLSEETPLIIVPHERPVFGDSSRLAARAMIAADALGQGAALRDRLRGARAVVDRAYLVHIARTLDIDAAALFAEMDAPATARRLAEARALAQIFGLPGTPGLVIGRTAISGAVSADTLARVAEAERRGAPCV